jgi:predicted nucleotide-binding protein (sugar kinase/HSP70/actin superfamily)
MGDASRIVTAFFRHRGIAARAIPTDTPASRERGAALIKTETCFPLKGAVGDVTAFLDELAAEHGGREQVGAAFLLALPTASGPCRLGKYAEVLRILWTSRASTRCPSSAPPATTPTWTFSTPPEPFRSGTRPFSPRGST